MKTIWRENLEYVSANITGIFSALPKGIKVGVDRLVYFSVAEFNIFLHVAFWVTFQNKSG